MNLPDLPDDPEKIQRAAELLDEAFEEEDEPGPLIKEARTLLGWKQAELGRTLDLRIDEIPNKNADGETDIYFHCKNVSNWERGRNIPSFKNRKKLRTLAKELQSVS